MSDEALYEVTVSRVGPPQAAAGPRPLPPVTALLPLGAGWEPDPKRPGWWVRA